jgi:tetratricopeptide (TPR) repeat protein
MNRTPQCVLRVWLGLIFLLWLPLARGMSDFDKGVAEYAAGHYSEAAASFEQELTQGRPTVGALYNLGNARYRNGEIGRAIAAWRFAERAAPGRRDIHANLDLARSRLSLPGASSSSAWVRRFPPGFWAVLAAIGTWIWTILLLVCRWRPAMAHRLRRPVAGLGAATVILLLVYSVALAIGRSSPDAVVVVRGTGARFGPVEESPVALPLGDGTEVRIEEERGDWVRVLDANGHGGWLPRDQVVQIPD